MSEAAEAHLPLRAKANADNKTTDIPTDGKVEQQANNHELEMPPQAETTTVATFPQQQLNGSVKLAVVSDKTEEQDGKLGMDIAIEEKKEDIEEDHKHSLCKWPRGRGWFTQVRPHTKT